MFELATKQAPMEQHFANDLFKGRKGAFFLLNPT